MRVNALSADINSMSPFRRHLSVGLAENPPSAEWPLISTATLRWADSRQEDRKSTRLNSSHLVISYAGFCSKKKKSVQSASVSLPLIPSHKYRSMTNGSNDMATKESQRKPAPGILSVLRTAALISLTHGASC